MSLRSVTNKVEITSGYVSTFVVAPEQEEIFGVLDLVT
jgi:hypothetical protein